MSNYRSCTHIKVTGVRCDSPALRGEQFCYFHQNAHRGVRRPKQSRLHPIALIEDEESIQYALMEVINALMRNTIDLKRAGLIIRALHIAVKNAARVKFGILGKHTVKEIPEYAAPPVDLDDADTSEADLPYSAFLPPQSEHQIAEQRRRANKAQEWRDQQAAIRANLERAAQTVAGGGTRGVRTEGVGTGVSVGTSAGVGTSVGVRAGAGVEKGGVDVGTGGVDVGRVGLNVGTGAFARPATLSEAKGSANVGADAPVRPGREATVPTAAATANAKVVASPAAAVPPHDFKKTPQPAAPPQTQPDPSHRSKPGNPEPNSAPRKPPATVNPAPKERKNAAHRASGG